MEWGDKVFRRANAGDNEIDAMANDRLRVIDQTVVTADDEVGREQANRFAIGFGLVAGTLNQREPGIEFLKRTAVSRREGTDDPGKTRLHHQFRA